MTDSQHQSGKDEIETSVAGDVQADLREQEPPPERKAELRDEHTHHLVRETTSQLTMEADVGEGVEAEATAYVPDMFCFTCDEWVGLSGVELRGKPRSKDDAFYLGGPPESIENLRDKVHTEIADLAATVIDRHPSVDDPEDAADYVAEELEQVANQLYIDRKSSSISRQNGVDS